MAKGAVLERKREIPVDVLREIVARVQSSGAVDYSPRDGVTCEVCRQSFRPGENMGVEKTMPWIGTSRVRYHRCPGCGHRFKSVESV